VHLPWREGLFEGLGQRNVAGLTNAETDNQSDR
jgi:hypothetical protein